MTDPILNRPVAEGLIVEADADRMLQYEDALRAVLDLLGAHIPGDVKWINDHEIRRVIAENLGVTDEGS